MMALCKSGMACNHSGMANLAILAAPIMLAIAAAAPAQDAGPAYDYRERTRAMAFDPARFFGERPRPYMSIRYMGDDYGYPVYAIAVAKGCTDTDIGEARRTCGDRLTARMVRAPFAGEPPRPRARGQRLFGMIATEAPGDEAALLRTLDKAGLEWLEADVRSCPAAMAHLATGRTLAFSPVLDGPGDLGDIVLHADKVSFEVGDYLVRSRYDGWLKPGTPAAWANAFARSLETCWKPAAATVPWRVAGDRPTN